MTKKHFTELAEALRNTQPIAVGSGAGLQWAADVQAIADFCQAQNPHFDRRLWLAYIAGECGPGGGKLKQ